MAFGALILAAGQGTRMISSLPKVLHPVCEVPMVLRVIGAVESAGPSQVGLVIGHSGDDVKAAVAAQHKTDFIWQRKQAGSGHAVKEATSWIRKCISKKIGHILILSGDTPLIAPETLKALYQFNASRGLAVTVLTSQVANPFGYGRIVRDPAYRFKKIVEEKDASASERQIQEINSGIYCFDAKRLLEALPLLKNDNAKKEYYLTDVIGYFYSKGYPMETFGQYTYDGASETLGVNSRAELADAEQILQGRIQKAWMKKGVTILNPGATYIGGDVHLAAEVFILPGTMIVGKTRVGEGSKIGPNSYIEGSDIGAETEIRASFVYGSRVGDKAKVGPFTHLRTGSVIKTGARVGNFSEVKNSTIGLGSKVSHLSYVGDTTMGDGVNVGAGTITCNYDGVNKHKTVIGPGVFVGSNTNLVAPVRIGAGALIAAGSTVTADVPADALVIARAQQVVKKGWAGKNRKNKVGNKSRK